MSSKKAAVTPKYGIGRENLSMEWPKVTNEKRGAMKRSPRQSLFGHDQTYPSMHSFPEF